MGGRRVKPRAGISRPRPGNPRPGAAAATGAAPRGGQPDRQGGQRQDAVGMRSSTGRHRRSGAASPPMPQPARTRSPYTSWSSQRTGKSSRRRVTPSRRISRKMPDRTGRSRRMSCARMSSRLCGRPGAVEIGRRGIKRHRQVGQVAGDEVELRRAIHPQRDVGLAEQQVLAACPRATRSISIPGSCRPQVGQDRRQQMVRRRSGWR